MWNNAQAMIIFQGFNETMEMGWGCLWWWWWTRRWWQDPALWSGLGNGPTLIALRIPSLLASHSACTPTRTSCHEEYYNNKVFHNFSFNFMILVFLCQPLYFWIYCYYISSEIFRLTGLFKNFSTGWWIRHVFMMMGIYLLWPSYKRVIVRIAGML